MYSCIRRTNSTCRPAILIHHWTMLCVPTGAFCDVYRATRKDTRTSYAIKIFRNVYYSQVMSTAQSSSSTMSGIVQHEMQVLKQCRHENIVSYYGCLPSRHDRFVSKQDTPRTGSRCSTAAAHKHSKVESILFNLQPTRLLAS